MPIRANRFFSGAGGVSGYNDPSIGEAASNLAKMFAPPTGADMYAAAHARSENEKASRFADFYRYAQSPDYNRETAERLGVGAGVFNPNQGYYAVDQGNKTTLSTNAADNARALQQTRLQQQGETTRNMIAPLNEGQMRAPGLGRFFGMPDLPENTQGGVTLNPGQRYAGPGGYTAEGTPKPLSETEMKGLILGRQSAAVQDASVQSAIPRETIATADGPRMVYGSDAIGQRPAPAQQAPSNLNRLQTERAALPAGDPRIAEYDGAIAAEGRGAVADPFTTEAGSAAAKSYGELAKAGQQARGFDSDLSIMGELLTDTPTGITAGGRLKVAQYARDLGLKDVADGLTGGKTDQLTAANAIAQRIAPALRVPGSGAQSDRELQNFQASIPSILNEPGGNRIILETLRGGAAYKQRVGEIAERALRGEISRADADAQIAAVPTPFARFSQQRGPAGTPDLALGTAAPAPAQTTMPSLSAPVPPAQQGQQAAAAGMPMPGTQSKPTPNARQIAHLRSNPGLASDFDAMFGTGAAAGVLGAR